MDLHIPPFSHDFCLDEDFRQRFSLLATGPPLRVNEEREDEEDDDEIQMAMAQSQSENEAEVERATLQILQEEEDLENAIFESNASFLSEREMMDIIRISGEEFNEEVMNSSVELQEQMLEWLQESPDEHAVDEYEDEGEELPRMYKKYRLIPTLFSEDEMWPPSAVQQQLIELQVNRGMEDVREWQNNQSEDERCLVCLTNVATRLAVPCGHRLSCRPCLSSLVRQDNYYAVTAADGQVVLTDRRIPIQCCTCRSIIGQVVTIH